VHSSARTFLESLMSAPWHVVEVIVSARGCITWLHHVAVHHNTWLHHVAVHHNTWLHHVAVHHNTWQCHEFVNINQVSDRGLLPVACWIKR